MFCIFLLDLCIIFMDACYFCEHVCDIVSHQVASSSVNTNLSCRPNNNICEPHIGRKIVRGIKWRVVIFFPQSYSRSQTELYDDRSAFCRGHCTCVTLHMLSFFLIGPAINHMVHGSCKKNKKSLAAHCNEKELYYLSVWEDGAAINS